MPRQHSKRIGALWKHGPSGQSKGAFLTGTLDLGVHGAASIAVFKNDRKSEGSKQPDYNIVLSELRAGMSDDDL